MKFKVQVVTITDQGEESIREVAYGKNIQTCLSNSVYLLSQLEDGPREMTNY
jgi:hypothetical protein